MSASIPVIVANLPSQELAYTNRIFVRKDKFIEIVSLNPELKVHDKDPTVLVTFNAPTAVGSKQWIFQLSHGPGTERLGADDIGFNALQRKCVNLSLQQPLQLSLYNSDGSEAASTITVSIDLLKKGSTGGKGISLNVETLEEEFKARFANQMLQKGQLIAFAADNGKYDAVIERIEPPSLGGSASNVEVDVGEVRSVTKIDFTKRVGSQTPIVFTVGNESSATNSNLFKGDFDFETVGIGGLGAEFQTIFRRAFASRIFPGFVKETGMNHVRGILLYGPPGCGKTLIARQIGKILNAKEPKIVNGPEILDKFVGGSEQKIRDLFADADKDQKELGDSSPLHVIIFDEMDAIMKTRGSTSDNTGVQDSVVNQLLSKIDGVDSLNNILIIGMTNRKDMIDEAILRPGRLELHVEIGLPTTPGRLQIIEIHTEKMRKNKRLSDEAIQKLPELAELTRNFTGAEIEGLVRGAMSFAFARNIDMKDIKGANSDNIRIEWSDLLKAVGEISPAFGNKDELELSTLFRNGLQSYGDAFDMCYTTLTKLVNQSRSSSRTPLMTVLLEGVPGAGKTAIAAKIASDSEFPLIRMISADSMVGYSETSKCHAIQKAFMDAYRSSLSMIFIDDIERIIEYTPMGPRFSNVVLQTLLVYLKKVPPVPESKSGLPSQERRLMIVATTSIADLLEQLQVTQVFNVTLHVSQLQHPSEISAVLRENSSLSAEEVDSIAAAIIRPIGIKKLLMVLEMVISSGDPITADTFLMYLETVGY